MSHVTHAHVLVRLGKIADAHAEIRKHAQRIVGVQYPVEQTGTQQASEQTPKKGN